MAKFTFPVSIAQLEKFLTKEGKAELSQALGGEPNDVEFVFKVLKAGWTNKQYHKDKQMRDRETMEAFKKLQQNDPERLAQLMAAAKK